MIEIDPCLLSVENAFFFIFVILNWIEQDHMA